MHERAVFTDMLPVIAMEGGLVFLTVNRAGHSVCTTIHNFEVFMEEARRKIVAWHEAQARIVPFKPRADPDDGPPEE